ncbi:MAG: hypothetical protein ABSA27_02490 [Terriglobales bacterium]|jgi:hypothetical protein
MSREELALLASRAFALLLTTWALVDVTYLPEHLFALSHYMSQRSVLALHDYWATHYLIVAVLDLVRLLALFYAAALFWRCGPRVEALFSPQQDNQQPPAESR